ncbi:MAG: ATP-binding protein [Promethearchaeota archaeon]
MNKKLIRNYFEDWAEKKLPVGIKRELMINPLRGKVISIVGPRRSGKTWYFFMLMQDKKKNSLYLDFEDSALLDIKYHEFIELINYYTEITGIFPKHLFLDEIQNIDNWESGIRTLLDRTNLNIYITGSSSKLLGREIATQLRGRSLTYILLPFNFKEFLNSKNVQFNDIQTDKVRAKVKNLLKNYLEWGGYPEVALSDQKEKILREYYDAIYFRDFVERHRLRSLEVARFIFSFMFQNFSNELTINRMVNLLKSRGIKMGKNTVYSYFENLKDTFAVFFINRFSQKISLRESWPKKIYICDTGISKILRFSEDIGKLMENCVYLELFRQTNENPITEIYYFKDNQGREVDFLIKEGENIKQLIQVTYASDKDDIEKREINSLLKAGNFLNCRNLICITWDYEAKEMYNKNEIVFLPLWKWLLN